MGWDRLASPGLPDADFLRVGECRSRTVGSSCDCFGAFDRLILDNIILLHPGVGCVRIKDRLAGEDHLHGKQFKCGDWGSAGSQAAYMCGNSIQYARAQAVTSIGTP